ncbi:MAG: hypothetical protein RL115_505 [Bacteroidota bacterium]|jgi:gliding motility-associated-like protein
MNKHCYAKLPTHFLAFLFFLTTTTAIGQGFYNTTNWRFSNPKQFGFTLLDLDFVDNNRGIAVGANGGIAYTTDGGTKWSYGAFTFMNQAGILASTSFQDVHFISATTAYAVGSNGCMAKTTDGGENWVFVRTPLFANAKKINTTWFLNESKGYIGGEWNTPDSIPKVYFTNNGGTTWDSLISPIGTTTRIGYINNPNVPAQLFTVTGKGKEIMRIVFNNDNTGYISGNSQHASGGPTIQIPAVNATTCLPTGAITTTTGHQASLLWKFTNGTLVDYSTTKERMGYSGVPTSTILCNTRYAGNVGAATNSYTAMHIINDSALLLISSNNNFVTRVYTGKNDSTVNVATGLKERGRYEILNYPSPPNGIPIPANPLFSFTNPTNIVKAANGKIYVPVTSPLLNPRNLMLTSLDTGRTWTNETNLPTGRNYSTFGATAIDILPSGKFVVGGSNGVVADSIPGGRWSSNYIQYTLGSYNKMDWVDCNNGMAAGGGFIATTKDGGKTWNEFVRADFNSLGIQINSAAYIGNNPAKAYFATSIGSIYRSDNINVLPPASPTIVPYFTNATEQAMDVATIGNDSVWVCGQSGFSVAAASRSPKVFRSTNGGTTWTTFNGFNVGTTAQTFRNIEFPTRLVGYVSGSRDTVWKTTDGGVTWNKLPVPTPGVTPQISYTDMFALDANTVFLVGQGFPRKAVFRTTDGGTTWQDITSNILSIFPVGNFNSVVFHDINNGYVGCAGGFLVTNNGGSSWRLDVPPSNTNHTSMAFAPKTVPAGTPFANRRLFTVGVFGNHILEYGDTTKLNVSSSEAITTSCTNTPNGGIVVNATGGLAPYTYSLDGGQFQTSNIFNNVGGGNYTIVVRDAGCGLLTKSITVGTRPIPLVNAGPDKTMVAGDNGVYLEGGATNTNPVSVTWTPAASLTNATTFLTTAKPANTTTYTLTVTDANGCVATDNAVVTVLPYCLKVMDAFTPNGDGQNDRWIVTNNGGQCVQQVYVTVHNRYGSIVYKNDNYQNNWDGTYNGKPIADGTYYYVVKYTLVNGGVASVKGDVTILR